MCALHGIGFELYEPFGENTRCDLILDDGNRLLRVQWKTGRLRGGTIIFSVCSCYGHHRNPGQSRRNYKGRIDFFAVYCRETGGVYLVPIGDLPMNSDAAGGAVT
jgi:hypothetical protein